MLNDQNLFWEQTRFLKILHKNVKTIETAWANYVGRSESKERFAIQRYLLIIGKKKYMQVLSHTFTYFST